jgi:hypothetical protein
MTIKTAIGVVEEIIYENRENGELEGIFSKYRVAALNCLLRRVRVKTRPKNGGKRKARL